MSSNEPFSVSALARFHELWDEVSKLVPGTGVTEREIYAYIAGTLPPDQLEQLEHLLADNPGLARSIGKARRDFAAHYTAQRRAETGERFRQALRRLAQTTAEDGEQESRDGG